MENDRIAKRERGGSCSVGRLWKRWIETMKDCLKKKDLDVRLARRLVHNRSLWWGFVRGNALGVAQGMNP